MKKLILLSILFCGLSVSAQWHLNNRISAQSHPENLLFNSFWIDNPENHWPLLSADLGVNYQWHERWRFEAAMGYSQARIVTPWSPLSFPDEIDPFYGFVRQTSDPSVSAGNLIDIYHWLAIKSGVAFRLNENRKHQFWLPAGLQVLLPLMPRSRSGENKYSASWPESKLHLLSFYGLYFRPTYQYTFGRSRWAMEFFANTDLLMRNEADNNPHFIFGGGLGVNYRLSYR